MRPRFRASTVVYAARYAPTADALGSMQPGYAAARHALRGTLLPSQDGADPTAAGAAAGRRSLCSFCPWARILPGRTEFI